MNAVVYVLDHAGEKWILIHEIFQLLAVDAIAGNKRPISVKLTDDIRILVHITVVAPKIAAMSLQSNRCRHIQRYKITREPWIHYISPAWTIHGG